MLSDCAKWGVSDLLLFLLQAPVKKVKVNIRSADGLSFFLIGVTLGIFFLHFDARSFLFCSSDARFDFWWLTSCISIRLFRCGFLGALATCQMPMSFWHVGSARGTKNRHVGIVRS